MGKKKGKTQKALKRRGKDLKSIRKKRKAVKVSEGKVKGGKQCKATVEKEVGKTSRKKQAGKVGSEKKST